MSLFEDIAVLRRVSLLAGLTDEQLRLLAFSGERQAIAEGETVFEAGAPAAGAMVVLAGRMRVLMPDEHGDTRSIGPATLINAPALIVEARQPFRAEAETDCEILLLRRSVFRRLLDEFPAVAARLHAELASRLAGFAGELARIGERLTDGES